MRVPVLIAIAVASLSGCASLPAELGAVPAPEWAPGHTWSYTWDRSHAMEGEHDRGEQWSQADEDVVFTVLRNHTMWDEVGWLVHQDGRGADVPMAPQGDLLWIREPDLRPATIRNPLTVACDGSECSHRVNPAFNTDAADQDGPLLDFPLAAGKSWAYTFGGERYLAEVIGPSVAQTDAGRLDAVHVRYTLHEGEDPREELEAAGATIHRYDVVLDQVMHVHFAPDAEWVVLSELRFHATFDVDVEWPDGERWMDQGTASLDVSQRLTHFDLAETDPATDEDFVEMFGEGQYLPGPYGHPTKAPADANVTVEVAAPERVNAATTRELTLRADAVGDSDTYTHVWRVWNDVGSSTHTGPDVTIDTSRVQHYVVEVMTYDNRSQYVHHDRIDFPVVYEVAVDGTCGASVLGTPANACDAIEFPMNDLRDVRLVVSGQVEPGLAADGRLVVLDAAGREIAQKALRDGQATIDVREWGNGMWTAQVEAPTGLGTPVHYDVLVEPPVSRFWR